MKDNRMLKDEELENVNGGQNIEFIGGMCSDTGKNGNVKENQDYVVVGGVSFSVDINRACCDGNFYVGTSVLKNCGSCGKCTCKNNNTGMCVSSNAYKYILQKN